MSLTDFMRNLVADPKGLAQYKHDPAAYLKGTDLAPEDQELLSKMTHPFFGAEVSTVMSVRMPPAALDNALSGSIRDGAIQLDGLPVTITSPKTIFLAEKGAVECRLLQHSYLHIDPNDSDLRVFGLNLCYVNPKDPNDIPFVLQIQTVNTVTEPTYNLANATVTFDAKLYVLLLADTPATRILGNDSYYDPNTKVLSLNTQNVFEVSNT